MTCNVALCSIRYGLDQQAPFCLRVKSSHPGFAVRVSVEMLHLWPWELRTELYRYFISPVGYSLITVSSLYYAQFLRFLDEHAKHSG